MTPPYPITFNEDGGWDGTGGFYVHRGKVYATGVIHWSGGTRHMIDAAPSEIGTFTLDPGLGPSEPVEAQLPVVYSSATDGGMYGMTVGVTIGGGSITLAGGRIGPLDAELVLDGVKWGFQPGSDAPTGWLPLAPYMGGAWSGDAEIVNHEGTVHLRGTVSRGEDTGLVADGLPADLQAIDGVKHPVSSGYFIQAQSDFIDAVVHPSPPSFSGQYPGVWGGGTWGAFPVDLPAGWFGAVAAPSPTGNTNAVASDIDHAVAGGSQEATSRWLVDTDGLAAGDFCGVAFRIVGDEYYVARYFFDGAADSLQFLKVVDGAETLIGEWQVSTPDIRNDDGHTFHVEFNPAHWLETGEEGLTLFINVGHLTNPNGSGGLSDAPFRDLEPIQQPGGFGLVCSRLLNEGSAFFPEWTDIPCQLQTADEINPRFMDLTGVSWRNEGGGADAEEPGEMETGDVARGVHRHIPAHGRIIN